MSEEVMAKIIGKNICRLLESQNMNQVDLSVVLNVSESTVGKWVLGKSIPRMGTIEKLSKYFNVNKSDLLNNVNLLNSSVLCDEQVKYNTHSNCFSDDEVALVKLWRDASSEGKDAARAVLTAYKKPSQDCAM